MIDSQAAPKPTVFFSHSSGDKGVLGKLKELFTKKTGGSIDVFLSSDGQSIKLGYNWVHSVEQALESARLMVVFITQASMRSSWIYFESGHAYAKGMRVIPVGLGGAQIGDMPPPLGLLQGFNINGHEGLNNLIHLVNEEFGHSHEETFTAEDYQQLSRLLSMGSGDTMPFGDHTDSLSEIVIEATFQGEEEYIERQDDTRKFSEHKAQLEEAVSTFFMGRGIEFTTGNGIGTYGFFIEIENSGQHETVRTSGSTYRHHCRMVCRIDPHLAAGSIDLARDMLLELEYSTDWFKVSVVLNEGFSFTREPHTASARMLRLGVGLAGPGDIGTHRWKDATFSIEHRAGRGILAVFCPLESLSVPLLHDIIVCLFQSGVFRRELSQPAPSRSDELV